MPVTNRVRVTTGRLLAVAIGIPLVIAAGADGAFDLVGYYVQTSEHVATSYPLGTGAVSLATNDGDITIVVGPANQVGVSYTEHYQLRKPTVSATTTGGGVQLGAKCPSGILNDNCAVNYVLTVPASTVLTLHSGDGNLQISGTTGSQSLDTGNGNVALNGVIGAVVARTGDGGISGTALGSPSVQATTGNGNVSLEWATAPMRVDATSGNGNIDIVVPAGSGPYRISDTTGNGSSRVTVPNESAASSSISVHTGDGDITIN